MRGLKSKEVKKEKSVVGVAPLVGAWIEILETGQPYKIVPVAPLVGAWIEMPRLFWRTNRSIRRTPCGCVD